MAAEPETTLAAFRIKDATRINLQQIMKCPRRSLAKVILLVGHSGAGKSSIAEHATKTVGYCNDTKALSTTDCEVLRTTIDGIEYFFETPLFPFVTIIASHWDSGMSLRQLEHRLEQRLDTLKDFIDGGASVLKYMEVYGGGTEKPDINEWFEQGRKDSILQQLQMIARQCRDSLLFGLQRRKTGNSASSTETPPSNERQGHLLRMFLFQNPLSYLNYGQSGSPTPGPDFVPAILRDDSHYLNDTLSFPSIPSERFNFLCHLGIVAIRDEVFADNTLSFRDKLATGRIYEHPGPDLERSMDLFGRRVDSQFLRNITAL